MTTHGKKYQDSKKEKPAEPVSVEEAVAFLKKHPVAKFDESVELSLRLGVDPRKTDQTIRGSCNLPHGSGKKVRVAVFAVGPAADAARESGADFVGMDDLLEKVRGGWTDFDVAIATTEAMAEVRKLGRVLGPRGLMPNPRTGTVTDNVAEAVAASKGGKVDFRMDRTGNVAVLCGKLSFEEQQLVQNVNSVIEAVRHEKPAALKGSLIRGCTLSSTMGVGVKVDLKD